MFSPRVLIVRFSAIGDCVMAVPVASAIRRAMPDSFIAWAVDPRCMDVLDVQRLVDLRFEVPRQKWKKDKTSWLRQLRHFAHLRQLRFDYGFDLQGHSKTALCLRFAAPKHRIALRATDLMAHALNPIASGRKKKRHMVELNLQVLHTLMDVQASSEPIMPSLDSLPSLPEQVREDRLVTISVSAGSPKKTYPLERWRRAGSMLAERGYDVAFLGGPGDPSPNMPEARDWVDKLPLSATMAAVVRSRVHLAADTGTGHIAAAYGVPVVSVFGYTDPREFRPYSEGNIILDAGRAMDKVSPEQVVEAAESLAQLKHAVPYK